MQAGFLSPLGYRTCLNAVESGEALLDLNLVACLGRVQVESTVAIQALQPRVKEIQERYKGRDPQEAQVLLLILPTLLLLNTVLSL